MPRKSLAVLVAGALAVIASAAAYTGLHSAQQKASKNATLTSVYVLKGVVPRNESAAAAYLQGLIKATRMPLQLVPAGAVTNLAAIRDQEAGYNLPEGEVVTGAMFMSPKSNGGVAAQRVPQGDVAVSVSVDQTHGVAGLIQPGDKVDILVDIDGAQETYLYQLVPVLAVGSTLVPARGTTAAKTTAATRAINVIITFAVPRAAAARIALANSGSGGIAGGLYLALVAARSSAASATTITRSNLVPGGPTITGSNPVPGGPTNTGSNPVPAAPTSGGRVEGSDTDENHP